ncbi:alpha/beta fold hydrolase [Streptomyces sp. NPDC047990]|uniref:alpha/beta fold hydrolase n=1 Tax=Streptomyces sp. NPDC047990 TaxID=3365496 RepID=UPI00371B24EE
MPHTATDLMATTQRPIAAAALEEGANATAWQSIPTWSLVATADYNIPPASQRFMSERANVNTVELDASHAVSVSQPLAVARLIEDAAESTDSSSPRATRRGHGSLRQPVPAPHQSIRRSMRVRGSARDDLVHSRAVQEA